VAPAPLPAGGRASSTDGTAAARTSGRRNRVSSRLRPPGFLIDLRRLPDEHRKLFVESVPELLRPALDAGAHTGAVPWPQALRIHRIGASLRNTGTQPVTRYLIRIAVDKHPGDPERSNRLFREDPLTWEEVGLSAVCGDEPMSWRVKEDRDGSKEVWLLFENGDGRFPLYPEETAWISYVYTVKGRKWRPWWQRAVRRPLIALRPRGLQHPVARGQARTSSEGPKLVGQPDPAVF
jgi:hypothetical protein